MSQTKYQAIFYESRGDDECLGDIITSAHFDDEPPSEVEVRQMAIEMGSKYVQLYRDKYDNDQYDSLEEEYDF